MNFTPLHVYSGYSYLKSALKINEYIKKAVTLGYKNLSITDLNNFTVIPEFVKQCKTNNIKPIIGEDLIVEDVLLTFIVLNEQGYRNLLKLSNANQVQKITLSYVKDNVEGLAVILGSNSRLFKNSVIGSKEVAKFARGFDNFYIGLENHDEFYSTKVREFAFEYGYTLIAFPFVKYLKKDDAIALAMLDNINAGIPEPLPFQSKDGPDYLLNEKELNVLYTKQELEEANKIAENVDFEFVIKRGQMLHYENELGLSSDDYLRKIA
ncbi:MAG: PHP domain-containing protein, partial [Bacilli bacterium]|nr:PHP domain-containing protein [Bacilli bacterium]